MVTLFNGILTEVLPLKTGPRKSTDKYSVDDWRKQQFVVIDVEQNKVSFLAWDTMTSVLSRYKKGDWITVEYVLSSRLYKENYYTDATAIRITPYLNPAQARIVNIADGIADMINIAYRLRGDGVVSSTPLQLAQEIVERVDRLIAELGLPDEYKQKIQSELEQYKSLREGNTTIL